MYYLGISCLHLSPVFTNFMLSVVSCFRRSPVFTSFLLSLDSPFYKDAHNLGNLLIASSTVLLTIFA